MNPRSIIFLAWLLFGATVFGERLLPELPDPQAVQAYQQYWQAFDAYEQKHLRQQKGRWTSAWNQLRQEFRYQDQKLAQEQIETLRQASERYQAHLKRFPDASNRPFVMLNLAQIFNILGDHYRELDAESGTTYKTQALLILGDLAKEFPRFEKAEEARYLRAIIFTDLDQKESAYRIWQRLADEGRPTLYTVHAMVALGDVDFAKERAPEALASYRSAAKLLRKTQTVDKGYERLRLQYRIAWAAYRSAELSASIEAGIKLLQPHALAMKISVRQKIEQDAVDLIADALFEHDDLVYTKSTLSRRILQNHAAPIIWQMIQRYMDSGAWRPIPDLGEFAYEHFPTTQNMPDILTALGTAYDKLGREEKRLATLEKLSMMLPEKSLWRLRNQDHFDAIHSMETKALAATILLAAHSYEKGMINASVAHFNTASSYYDLLLTAQPNHEKAEQWRLKKAHCHYFAGDLDEADSLYRNLKEQHQVQTSTLEVAAYQQVMTRERKWRQVFQQAAREGEPNQDPKVIEALRQLEKSIEHFANRFPQLNRAVELLLVGASANRDMARFTQAAKFWQRVLVSQPSPAQRAMAIRGLVMSKVKSGQPEAIINVTKRYLRLENWDKLGVSLGKELRGILATATTDASEKLNHKGRVVEAGHLLLDVVREFPKIPNYHSLFRDGAYMLAIGGEWNDARQAAENYLASPHQKVRGDMQYLQARAFEYQLRFKQAAIAYLDLARKFPRHSRSQSALTRAESLAKSESDLSTAAAAAYRAGQLLPSRVKKLDAYLRSAEYYSQDSQHSEALKAIKQANRHAQEPSEKMRCALVEARETYAQGQQALGLKRYKNLARMVKRHQDDLDAAVFRKVFGESTFKLGLESFEKFNDFDIFERSGGLKRNIEQKARYFESVVRQFEKTISVGHPEWSTRARYLTATAAETLSDNIAEARLKHQDSFSQRSDRQLQSHAKRLLTLSRQYHSQNLLQRQRKPRLYRHNQWINRSQVKLAGYLGRQQAQTNQEQMPFSLTRAIPYQWSL
jgi:hypothetical protein